MHSVAAMDARRMAHKYVDGYYSRLAALRKRSENFRGTDINTVVMRLRPSETQCNTSESGASCLYDVTHAHVRSETIKEPIAGERRERNASLLAIFGNARFDIRANMISRRKSFSNHDF